MLSFAAIIGNSHFGNFRNPSRFVNKKDTKIFEHRVDNYWNDQVLLYNYESNLTTGEEIEIDEEKELSIVVDGQRSETYL
jgi:hypothetical protein